VTEYSDALSTSKTLRLVSLSFTLTTRSAVRQTFRYFLDE
jgi:hypothetical protein